MATATLKGLFAQPAQADPARTDDLIGGFTGLDAHPGAEPAMRALHSSGIPIVTLTTGSANVTEKLLERAGLRDFVERTITVDEVKRWKPHREVYLHCAQTVGVDPRHLALIAAHGWDIHGANRAGLITGYVGRNSKPFPDTMDLPDVMGSTLVEVTKKLSAQS